jgi:hypothetical protein
MRIIFKPHTACIRVHTRMRMIYVIRLEQPYLLVLNHTLLYIEGVVYTVDCLANISSISLYSRYAAPTLLTLL